MKTLREHPLVRRHLDGPGGISALLPIAVPMIISQIFDTLMTFVDRLYLAYVGKEEIAACMSGGITAWLCMTLFVGIIGYSSTIVAHHYGAKRFRECPLVVYQGLLLAVLSYPLVLVVASFASRIFTSGGHDPVLAELELQYFWYMAFGGILALLRTAVASFFAGIGKTKVIMWANSTALLVNLVANYVLIFGKLGLPAMGLKGAAIGTLMASATMTVVICVAFLREIRRAPYSATWADVHYNWRNLRALLRFGLPNGVENLLGMGSFVAVVTSFNSYGANVAAATTIVFSWDLVSFFPLIGIQVGVCTLVGQCMGAKNPAGAEQAAYSGFKLALVYSGLALVIFCTIPQVLVGIFTPDNVPGLDYGAVRELAVQMLRLAALYLMFDGIVLVSSGALRGAGDTLWVMIVGTILQWTNAGVVLIGVHVMQWQPIYAWLVFVFAIMTTSAVVFMRFKHGKWKSITMLEPVEEGSA
ncbi:MAG: MATE family efflux transporter [Lentisphaeria bacterium]|nr:MATE family efflux transporter [Lentisphaeria bacterium]